MVTWTYWCQRKCIIQSSIIKQSCLPAYWKVVKEATCQEEGLVQVICAVTGDVVGENAISKIPHKFDNNAEYCAYGCGTKTLTIKHL